MSQEKRAQQNNNFEHLFFSHDVNYPDIQKHSK